MSDVFKEKVQPLIKSGDIEACYDYFFALNKKERRAIAKDCQRLLRVIEANKYKRVDLGPDRGVSWQEREGWREASSCGWLAVMVTCNWSELKRLDVLLPQDDDELLIKVLKRLKPDWIDKWVNHLLDGSPSRMTFAYHLHHHGVCQRPTCDEYIIGFINAYGMNYQGEDGTVQAILNDPEFMNELLWRLFKIEGLYYASLSNNDRNAPKENSWTHALVELSKRGHISRERLLDESLTSLGLGFKQSEANWYSRFHEAMKPTTEERSRFKSTYIELLNSQNKSTVAFALKALMNLNKQAPFPCAELLPYLESAMLAQTKTATKTGLKLLKQFAENEADAQPAICLTLAVALLNEHSDIQEQAVEMLIKYGDPSDTTLCEQIQLNIESVLPSLVPGLSSWVEPIPQNVNQEPWEVVSDHQSPVDYRIKPIGSVEEMLEVALHVMEHVEDVVSLERLLGARCRLGKSCYEMDDWERLSSPVRKRSQQLCENSFFYEEYFRDYVNLWLKVWVEDEELLEERKCYYRVEPRVYFETVFARRLIAIHQQARTYPGLCLLSEPMDRRGFIDPLVLVERAIEHQSRGCPTDTYDRSIALLRMSNRGREEALVKAKQIKGVWGQVLRFALGGDEIPSSNAKLNDQSYEDVSEQIMALWITAARARDPRGDYPALDQFFENTGPYGATVTQHEATVIHDAHQRRDGKVEHTYYFYNQPTPEAPEELSAYLITGMFAPWRRNEKRYNHYYSSTAAVLWTRTIWPGDMEPYFALAVNRIDLDWIQVQWDVRYYYEVMFEPEVELEAMAHLFITLGLAAKESGQHSAAEEVVIMTMRDGRLSTSMLSSQMSPLIHRKYLKCSRLAKRFKQISLISRQHAKAVCQIIIGILDGNPEDSPRDFGAVLEVLFETLTAINEKIQDTEKRAYLNAITAGGKTGKFARKLVKM